MLKETEGRSELSERVPHIAPILDVWFNPSSGRDFVTAPHTMAEKVRSELWRRAEDILGFCPQGPQRDLVKTAREFLEQVIRLSIVPETGAASRNHRLASREAVAGNPFTTNYLLIGEPSNSLKRRILATAHLVHAFKYAAFPTDENTEFCLDSAGVPVYSRRHDCSPNRALEASIHLDAGLLLLTQELVFSS